MSTWNPDPLLRDLPTRALLATLLFGEARGEDLPGQLAVASVVRNRAFVTAKGQPPTIDVWRAVILKPWAFSCFDNDGGSWNARKTIEFAKGLGGLATPAQAARRLLWIADGALADAIPDVSRGATHYYVRGSQTPKWAQGRTPVVEVDSHLFYKLNDTSYL